MCVCINDMLYDVKPEFHSSSRHVEIVSTDVLQALLYIIYASLSGIQCKERLVSILMCKRLIVFTLVVWQLYPFYRRTVVLVAGDDVMTETIQYAVQLRVE